MRERERWGSLTSGSGTTFEYNVNAFRQHEHPIEPAVMVSSKPDAGSIERAYRLGIPYKVVNPDDFRGQDLKVDQEGFGLAILKALKEYGVTVVTQNGWLPLTPKNVIDEFSETIFNQHPGPKKETRATYGIQPHAIMLYLARKTGRNNGTEVTVHRVTERFDEGETVGISHVPIFIPHDYPKRLQRRALRKEHPLQVTLLQQVARGEVREVALDTIYIMPGEEEILRDARRYARKKYPDG